MQSYIYILLISINSAFSQIEQNAPCKLSNTVTGKCVTFADCPNIYELIRINRKPEICGQLGRYPLVCCDTGDVEAVASTSASFQEINFPVNNNSNIFSKFENLCNKIYSNYDETQCDFEDKDNIPPEQEFPHMAVLGYKKKANGEVKYYCAGTLISDKHVLTLASCTNLWSSRGKLSNVRLGAYNLTNTINSQEFRVLRFYKSPEYNDTMYHNLAIVELDREVIRNDYVQPACLQLDRHIPEVDWTVTSWGLDSKPDINVLQKVPFSPIEQSKCNETFGSWGSLPEGYLDDLMVCAGGNLRTNINDTENELNCKVNPGSSISVSHFTKKKFCRGHTVLALDLITGTCDASEYGPNLFVRISKYIPWIGSIIYEYLK